MPKTARRKTPIVHRNERDLIHSLVPTRGRIQLSLYDPYRTCYVVVPTYGERFIVRNRREFRRLAARLMSVIYDTATWQDEEAFATAGGDE